MTAGQNSIYINKNYHHHYPFSTGSINPNFYSPQICKLYIFPLPRYFKLQIYHKVILYMKLLKRKLSSRFKKKKKKKSFSFSKMNLEQTICNTEDWFFFFLLKSGWKYFTHSLSHILPHLKKKITHTQLKNGTFLLGGGEVLVWVKKGIYS